MPEVVVAELVIPARPAFPPTVPAPASYTPAQYNPAPHTPEQYTPEPYTPDPPAPSRPEPATAPTPGPAIQPMFTRAPGLNWAGPGDHWSRAWALDALDGNAAPPAGPEPAPDPRAAAGQAPTPADIQLIRASLAVVEPVADRATAHFYALIFLHHPEVRALFPAAMDVQRDRLFRALLMAGRNADDLVGLTEYLTGLGRGHRKYGTLTGHYGPVGECLIAALERFCGNRWDSATELAWRRAYGLISKIMIEAAEGAAKTSPPWWQAEVVEHRQRTPDIAVVTVRPDQAYPYRAGQYTTLETPWWPRVWRHFSFATAPRPDGLLTFHVKAVQAGWVSNALVRRAAPGDVLRLGPPAGAMVVDHGSGTDLVCLGGGTGIAPISALVEEIAAYGPAGRSVEVFYGARRHGELYELETLRRLAGRNPWLSVRAVVSDERVATAEALPGDLPDLIGSYGPWAGRAAYLSGPAAMVRRACAALLRSGMADTDIHHDLAAG
ncbi:globin domain-containing protein [Kitasatospora kazusensis]|uniref:globin domain-containing protein n=1 Tax=Kitasatospora kazusensis TaxID=407974 RepID=UPI0031D583CC